MLVSMFDQEMAPSGNLSPHLTRNKEFLFFTGRSKMQSRAGKKPNIVKDHNSYSEDSCCPWVYFFGSPEWGGGGGQGEQAKRNLV